MSAGDHQDWSPVVIHGKAGSGGSQKSGGCTRPQNPEAARLRKLEESEAPQRPKVLTPESVATIQTYRREHNNMTQKDFDRLFSWPANTTNLLESRRAAPTPGQLRALNAQLKTGLTLG
jgi:hypothetical protein